MESNKKHILSIIIIAIASQIDLALFTHDFMISGGIIAFSIIYYFYRDLNAILTGIITGILVYLFRILVFIVGEGTLAQGLISFFPEVFFYIVFGLSINLFTNRGFLSNLNKMFVAVLISDILSNGTEMFIRSQIGLINLNFKIVWTLIMVAIIRALIVWTILNALKYYRILIINKEHVDRYRKFLIISSKLKAEMYLMEKNMDYIEKVMSRAYGLYDKISSNREQDSWEEDAMNIAKDVHEIKKDYYLVLHGVKEVTEVSSDDKDIYLHDILDILEESIGNLIKNNNIKVKLQIEAGENFLTTSHFYLMSILRNLLMNALDAVSERGKEGEIILIHSSNEQYHIFDVIDNGTGISKGDLDYIFSPGFSTKIDYSTGNVNRGLGLSIAKDIVENRLDGTIRVYSALEKGTNFRIQIPRDTLEVNK
ncbi:sensor histidine kinase [Clostridium sp. Cult3]|mgnify:CR=1 FL=1|uniref:sensor histidine kinase n=1 Tax=Clostridium sp. Cult3 TaxID=2079004 RepID=UPI001F267656|nr:sensor histidine kinase [Clostridium sp. Cult3]MCF6461175.1 ATP-binding protein [Clostridium sp. Cult3]